MNCECLPPMNVFNGVCGLCLLALPGTTHSECGKLIAYKKPKSKKHAKDKEIARIVYELERFGRLNTEDLPTVINALKKLA